MFRDSGRRDDTGPGFRPLKSYEFDQIRRLAHEKFGLDLRNGKEELVTARLGKRIRKAQFRSFEEYYQHVISDQTGEALVELIDSLTTNFTSFLREPAHFQFLVDTVLPSIRNRNQIDVWCAGCATGEEPYSLAFTLLDVLQGSAKPQIRILATDISTRALETAAAGIYAAGRFAEFPKLWLSRFLLRGNGAWEGAYRVKPEVRALIEFRRLNLIEPITNLPKFPVISCRNVMIYFDKDTQQSVVNKLTEWIEPGGYLFIGHSESLTGVKHHLQYVQPAIYRKPKDSGLPATGRTRVPR